MSEDKPLPEGLETTLQEKGLEGSPRLGPDDTFEFTCHPGVSCFNRCCGDVNIFLSPYDVLRMKRRLGMSSTEFLEKHALLPVQKDMKVPVVVLRMQEDEAKSCFFLTDEGCGIYTDRPWPCRMYPLALATQKDTPDGWAGEKCYFLLSEEGCKGFEETEGAPGQTEWTARKWCESQGLEEYDEWGDGWKEIALHDFFERGGTLVPEKMHMLFTACYDLDRFREFVFDSTLLERFEVDEDFVDEMRTDDEALLRFAFLWVRFSLFGEKTMKVKKDVLEAFKGKLDKKELFEKELAERGNEGNKDK